MQADMLAYTECDSGPFQGVRAKQGGTCSSGPEEVYPRIQDK